jgi:hypothetical protein
MGWQVQPIFQIGLHKKDQELLNVIQDFFQGTGKIWISQKDESCTFVVNSLEEILKVVIPHFDKYPLITKKFADFLQFREVVCIMKNKNHLTLDGLKNIVAIRASINKGLLDKKNFSSASPLIPQRGIRGVGLYIVPVVRPLMGNLPIPHPEWLAGFTCFASLRREMVVF